MDDTQVTALTKEITETARRHYNERIKDLLFTLTLHTVKTSLFSNRVTYRIDLSFSEWQALESRYIDLPEKPIDTFGL
jgi:hypothetical protein